MKFLKAISFILFFCVSSFSGTAQEGHPILDSFSAFEVDGTVYISCVISAGYTCNGIDVLKSEDTIRFTEIGNIAGVCGSSSNPVRYDFVDENPKINATSYYKLELGGVGFTSLLEVDVRRFRNNNLQIAPNPVFSDCTIFLDNPNSENMNVTVTSLTGEIMFRTTTIMEELQLNLSDWVNGIYIVHITSNSGSHYQMGKIQVVH